MASVHDPERVQDENPPELDPIREEALERPTTA